MAMLNTCVPYERIRRGYSHLKLNTHLTERAQEEGRKRARVPPCERSCENPQRRRSDLISALAF